MKRSFLVTIIEDKNFGSNPCLRSDDQSEPHDLQRKIADELAKAGHEVILFEPEFGRFCLSLRPAEMALISANVATVYRVGGFTKEQNDRLRALSSDMFQRQTMSSHYKTFKTFPKYVIRRCKEMLIMQDVMEKLRSYKFEIFFGEQLNLCGSASSHVRTSRLTSTYLPSPSMDQQHDQLVFQRLSTSLRVSAHNKLYRKIFQTWTTIVRDPTIIHVCYERRVFGLSPAHLP
ncbi:hypothetical protein L596_004424 [Steinernema carpocapsae]|uniref:glucuronosyltransferase n=1 Tax=Steinernema carpocapsae TaxID=34508 RepID=A0A4U8UZV9_STECR|nr:hypothetical protein L596_004424 [Steinernema carpocapsae]